MTLVLVVACAFVVGAGAVLVARRVVDERRAMRDHQHTLDTLRRVGAGSTPAVHHLAAPEPHLVVSHGDTHPSARAPGRAAPAPDAAPAHDAVAAHDEAPAPDVAPVHDEAPVPDVAPAHDEAPGQDPAAASPAAPRSADRSPTEVVAATSATRAVSQQVPPSPPGAPAGGAAAPGPPPEPERQRVAAMTFDDSRPMPTGPPTTVMAVGGRAESDPDPTAVLRSVAFDDTSAVPSAGGRPPGGRRRQPPRSLRLATLGAAVAVLAAVGVTAYVVARPSGSSSGSSAAGTSAPAGARGSARGSSGGAGSGRGSSVAIVAGSATATGATVSVPSASYTVTVSVTNACWVQGQGTGGGGSGAWSGVLTAGQEHAFSFSGPASLELGAADATITVGRSAVSLPTGYQVPFTLRFQPAG